MENDRDDGNYGCKESDWEIKFNNIMDEKWGVKLSPEEESNSSMKSNEEGLTKDRGSMSLTSCSCFTILIIDLIVLGIKIVSWELWGRLSPTMQQHPQPTTHCFPWEEVIGIWYTKFKTKLLESYKTSLDIWKDLS